MGMHRIFSRVSDHRPDEEGIKTCSGRFLAAGGYFQTTDLMKKGLRPELFSEFSYGFLFRPQT